MEYRDMKLVYRRYASLYFIVGIDTLEVTLMPTRRNAIHVVRAGTISQCGAMCVFLCGEKEERTREREMEREGGGGVVRVSL